MWTAGAGAMQLYRGLLAGLSLNNRLPPACARKGPWAAASRRTAKKLCNFVFLRLRATNVRMLACGSFSRPQCLWSQYCDARTPGATHKAADRTHARRVALRPRPLDTHRIPDKNCFVGPGRRVRACSAGAQSGPTVPSTTIAMPTKNKLNSYTSPSSDWRAIFRVAPASPSAFRLAVICASSLCVHHCTGKSIAVLHYSSHHQAVPVPVSAHHCGHQAGTPRRTRRAWHGARRALSHKKSTPPH